MTLLYCITGEEIIIFELAYLGFLGTLGVFLKIYQLFSKRALR
jgi:hypothetical protein